MLTFRQKIILAYIIIFLIFVGLMFPFATKSATAIMYKAMEDRADELIEVLQKAPSEVALIASLKEQKPLLFYRVTLLNDKAEVLYDSHTKRLIGTTPFKDQPVNHKEVIEALKTGIGYHEEYSKLLNQDFAYMAKSFPFQGQKYIVRISFPLRYVMQITSNFRIGYVILSTLILLLFSLLSWFIINHLTKPIQKIISAITPYQEGRSTFIPEITFSKDQSNEFGRLADTLNSLTNKIQQQISTLIRERKEKEIVLESLVEGVVAVDNLGVPTYSNSQAERFFRAQDVSHLFDDLHLKETIEAKALLKTAQTEGAALGKMVELSGESGRRFFYLVAVPMKGQNGAVLVIQDYTSQLLIVEMRRDFVANASHELRTPITIIQGFAETLQEPEKLSTDQIRQVTTKIVRNCERMTRLIKELLLLADIEQIPDSKLEVCQVDKLIEKALLVVKETHPQVTIPLTFEKDNSYEVIAVPDLIERAVLNLVDNAIKYSKEPIAVAIALKEIGNSIEITISDKGIGMKPADLEQIFHRFYRSSDVRSSQVRGSGLGLSIVETIVAKHRGKISVTSKFGQGSSFTISLPKRKSEIDQGKYGY